MPARKTKKRKTQRDAAAPSTPPPRGSWRSLPAEIQRMIWDELVEMSRNGTKRILGKCSSVCWSWRVNLELYIWRSLVITSDCLPELRAACLTKFWDWNRLEATHMLHLRIRLEDYDCDACQTVEDKDTIKRNCVTFTNAVWDFLKILSFVRRPWRSPDTPRVKLELIISVYSPSDYKHIFRPFCLQEDYPYPYFHKTRAKPPDYKSLQHRLKEEQGIHDPPHGWTNGTHTIPDLKARDRLFGSKPLEFDFSGFGDRGRKLLFDRQLPKAPIVHAFTVRRGSFRGFSANVLFKLLRESFTHIETLRIEKWQETYADERLKYEEDFYSLLHNGGLPETLKSVHLLRDQDDKTTHRGLPFDVMSLGRRIALASRHLESLSITNLADAKLFFWDFYCERYTNSLQEVQQWDNLKSLSLTCNMFRHRSTPISKINSLLDAAAKAASHMPQLQDMCLWRCGDGEAALFRYRRARTREGRSCVAWESSYILPGITHTKAWANWRKLAKERDPREKKPIERAQIIDLTQDQMKSHLGVMIGSPSKNFTPLQTLDPVTRFEVKWECFHKADLDRLGLSAEEDESNADAANTTAP